MIKNFYLNNKSLFKFLEQVFYVFLVLVSFLISYFIIFGENISEVNIIPFCNALPYIIIVSFMVFNFNEVYSNLKRSLVEKVFVVLLSVILINSITVAIVFFLRGFSFPRSVILLSSFFQVFLILFVKLLIRKKLLKNRKDDKILVIALDEEKDYILDKFKNEKVEKFSCNKINDKTFKLIEKVDKIYIGSTLNNKELIKYCLDHNKDFYIYPSLYDLSIVNSKMKNVDDIPFLILETESLSFEELLLKRIIDIVFSLLALLVSLPFLIIVSILIKLYDKGPVFFVQERITKNFKKFKLIKFRTMIVNAESKTGPILSNENDNRITKIGKALRSLRIDEIPQFINVLKGDMSIVGPRPEREYFINKFKDEIEEYKYRFNVKAGITGLAQIYGKYSTDAKIKAKYDLLYIKNYSFVLDVRIILNTIHILIKKGSSK